jgi:adenylate kinase family enzyme
MDQENRDPLRINIIGASGTGKSTLAKALSHRLQVKCFDADDYYHVPADPPFQEQRPPDERLSLIAADLGQHHSWVLAGSVAGWGRHPVLEFSLVVFLILPAHVRLERLRLRELQRFGSRILPGGDMEENHRDFMDWAAGYDSAVSEGNNNLPLHEEYIQSLPCPILRIERPMVTSEQVDAILNGAPLFSPARRRRLKR